MAAGPVTIPLQGRCRVGHRRAVNWKKRCRGTLAWAVPGGLAACLLTGVLTGGCLAGRNGVPALEEAVSVKPGINREFLNPDLQVANWVQRFEVESREVFAHRHGLTHALGLRPGDCVADIGAGTGLFVPLFAEAVGPQGHVYAVEIAPAFVEGILNRAREAGLANVTAVLGSDRDVGLEPGSIDKAFICDTYHHFEYPSETMVSLHRALRRGGEVLVIDFHRIPGVSSEWTLNHVRAGQEVFTAEIEAAGFRKVEELPLLEDNYVLRFRKVGR